MFLKIKDLPEARNKKDIPTTAPKTTVRAATTYMSELNVGAIAVVNKTGKLVGIFSERDLLNRVCAKGKTLDKTKVEDVMTPDPQTVTSDDSVDDAVKYMVEGGYRHLPVVDIDGKLTGMLSIKNFMSLNWRQMLARTGQMSYMAFFKSPTAFALIVGVIIYTILMSFILL